MAFIAYGRIVLDPIFWTAGRRWSDCSC